MKAIDRFLNYFTMYKVVLYGLIFLSSLAIFSSGIGIVPFSTFDLIISLGLITLICFVSNFIFAKIFKVQFNIESFAITSLILFLILTPYKFGESPLNYILFGVIAMGSKYVFVLHKKHIFNPVAISLVIMGLLGATQTEWWIGNKFLFPFVLLIGFLVVRKIRKISMFLSFFICALMSISFFAYLNKADIVQILSQAIPSWPLIFLGTIMLTEPLTTPPTRKLQIIYGAIVGILSGSQISIGPFYSTSETALVIGNIFSYFVSFRKRLVLEFIKKVQLSPNIYEFIFKKPKNLNFKSGQYFEWTLGHKRPDSRGMRRFFTISSSPTEDQIKLGIRMDEKSSSFKKALLNMNPGQKIYAGNLAGDFILPKTDGKLVFIAGGIGVTPFRSIVKYLIDKNQSRDIVIFYSNRDLENFVYKDIFELAKNIGIRTIYLLTKGAEEKSWNGYVGRLTPEIIKKEVPDYNERIYYISGTNEMVEGYKNLLKKLGIKSHKIKTDYFPGF